MRIYGAPFLEAATPPSTSSTDLLPLFKFFFLESNFGVNFYLEGLGLLDAISGLLASFSVDSTVLCLTCCRD